MMPVLPAHGAPLYSANPLTSLFPSTYHGFNRTVRSLEEENRKDKNAHTTTNTHQSSKQCSVRVVQLSYNHAWPFPVLDTHPQERHPNLSLFNLPPCKQTKPNQTKGNYEPTKTTTTPKNDDTAVIALTLSFFLLQNPTGTPRKEMKP